MTLERIPKKVINSIQRLSSNFLWNGTGRKHNFHLCGWEVLTRPKKTGGWGLKNLVYFNTALLASSFWRATNLNSIWHRIVADKYFGSLHFCEWLRKPSLIPKRASTFWRGLVAASPVILHRLSSGSGSEILVGRDKIIGVEDSSLLSPSLISKLDSSNRSNLAQVGRPSDSHYLPDSWLSATELALSGREAVEWDCYTSALKTTGISLNDNPDALKWVGGDATGIISVKNIYFALLSQQGRDSDSSWFTQLWIWKIPMKFKLFIWLAGKGKLLTWDQLRRRGWEGPGLCPLCRQAQEDINHLLIHCHFSQEVWKNMLNYFNLPHTWSGDTISSCFNSWHQNKSSPNRLAVILSWNLWIERFEDRIPSTLAVFKRVLASHNWHPSTLKPSPPKIDCPGFARWIYSGLF